MSDHINQRYVGMGAYDLQRYYDLLLIMREHEQADKSKTDGIIFILNAMAVVLIILLFGWSVLNNEWLALVLVVGLATSLFSKSLLKHTHESTFQSDFVAKATEAGFSRGDATEFLYDIDWDDVQYDESRIEDILKDLNELKNAKNK